MITKIHSWARRRLRTGPTVIVALSISLGACASNIELPAPRPDHPASPQAQAAPEPPESTTLKPMASNDAAPAPGNSQHQHHKHQHH